MPAQGGVRCEGGRRPDRDPTEAPIRTPARVPVALLLAGALLLATPGCGAPRSPDGPSPTTVAAPSTEQAPSASTDPTAGPQAVTEPAFEGTVVEVQVIDEQVRTDRPRVVVPVGERVRLVVTSDVVDEVHVHGVDEYLALTPGTPAVHEFTASIPGIFEVELHDAGLLVLSLQVEP